MNEVSRALIEVRPSVYETNRKLFSLGKTPKPDIALGFQGIRNISAENISKGSSPTLVPVSAYLMDHQLICLDLDSIVSKVINWSAFSKDRYGRYFDPTDLKHIVGSTLAKEHAHFLYDYLNNFQLSRKLNTERAYDSRETYGFSDVSSQILLMQTNLEAVGNYASRNYVKLNRPELLKIFNYHRNKLKGYDIRSLRQAKTLQEELANLAAVFGARKDFINDEEFRDFVRAPVDYFSNEELKR